MINGFTVKHSGDDTDTAGTTTTRADTPPRPVLSVTRAARIRHRVNKQLSNLGVAAA